MIWDDPEVLARLTEDWDASGSQNPTAFDKSWALSLGVSPAAVRTKRSRLGLVRGASVPQPSIAPEDPEDPEDEDDYRQAWQAVIAEEQTRHLKKRQTGFRRYAKRQIDRDWIAEVIDKRVRLLEPPKRRPTPRLQGAQAEVVCVLLSDMHLGSWTPPDYTGGLSEFDTPLFDERLRRLEAGLHRLLEQRRKVARVKGLRVFCLGDIIDGESIYENHAAELSMTVVDQVLEGAQALGGLLSGLAALVPELEVDCIVGNHGRVSHRASRRDNWEHFLYRFVKRQLSKHANVTVRAERAFHKLCQVGDKRYLLIHGHELRAANDPSLERLLGRYQGMIPGGFDYLVCGHHHTFKMREFNGCEVIMNPALVSPSTFAVADLALTGTAAQLAFGTSPSGRISWSERLYLE